MWAWNGKTIVIWYINLICLQIPFIWHMTNILPDLGIIGTSKMGTFFLFFFINAESKNPHR